MGIPKSAKDIGAVAGVSEGTIKLVYKFYFDHREVLVKKDGLNLGRLIWIDCQDTRADSLLI